MAHARLSPSAALRWVACPLTIHLDDRQRAAGVEVDEGVNGMSTDAILQCVEDGELEVADIPPAAKGSIAHALAEACLRTSLADADPHTHRLGDLLDDATLDGVGAYVDCVQALIARDPALCGIERKVQLWYEHGSYGTVDYWQLDDGTLSVLDLKTGYQYVSERRNLQLLIYAIALYDEMSLYDDVTHVRVGIFQSLRETEPRWEDVSIDDLERVRSLVNRAVADADDPFVPPIGRPSEDVCRWCPHTAACPALLAEQQALLGVLGRADLVEPAVLSDVLAQAPLIRQYLDAIEERVRGNITDFPYWKLVPGKISRREWKAGVSAKLVEAYLRTLKLDPHEKKLLTPAAVVKALKLRGYDSLDEWIEVKYNKDALVPSTDRRNALVTDEEVFEKLS